MITNPSIPRITGCFTQPLAVVLLSMIGLFADHASAARVNFAKYQTATASGQNSTYSPGFAVDGIVSNYHSFRTNNVTTAQWLEVSFPRAVTIASAHLYLGQNNDPALGLPSFKLQYHDGSGWVDVPGSAVTGNTATERSVIFSAAATSDRFRLYTDENGNRTIREMALFPPNLLSGVEQGYPIGTDVRLSLTYKRPAEGSTITANGYPKLAVDGYVDDASRWLCNSASGESLEIDLLDTHTLGSAHVYSGTGETGPLPDFTLQSWTGTAWTDIPGATITGNTSTARVVPFSSSVSTSRIRLLTTGASNGRIKELLVFPPRAGGYPLGQDVETRPPFTAKWDHFSDSSWKLDNVGPDVRLGLVNGVVVLASNAAGKAALDWQLLLNHRDGSYRVRHAATGDCLALANISLATGTPVVLATYSGMPHQDWILDYTTATEFRLINAYSGLALNSAASNWAVGTSMVVATPGTGALQRWTRGFSIHHPKKGMAATTKPIEGSEINYFEDTYNKLGGSWSYNWGRQDSGTFPFLPFNHTYNPMQWGNAATNWSHGTQPGPTEILRNDLQSSPKPAHLMGYNEPDREDQGTTTPDAAIARWPRLEALDAPLVAPCPANTFGDWLPEWAAKADARGLRRDYTPYHWYSSPSADQMIADLNQAYTTYGRPIWLTEFSAISWGGGGNWTKATNYNFLAEFMWRAEALTWLKRYALYQFAEGASGGTDTVTAPRSNARKADGSLTALGELYAGWDGVTSVLPDKAYHVHNRGAYKRMQNPAVASDVGSVDPETSTAGSQWFLTPGITADTYRLVSTRDGRLLRWYSTVPVSLAVATQTATFVEWRLVPDQHGWYFIEQPSSNQRLKDNGNGTLGMGAITSSGDSYKWRFAVPAVIENVAPVLAAIPSKTVDEGALLTFTASATDTDLPANVLSYSLLGEPGGAAIDAGTGVFTWTPTEAQGPGVFNFTVRVSDGNLTVQQPVSVTVDEVNMAPVLATIPPQTINKDALLTFTASATDADLPANTLTYSLVGEPGGAAIDPGTGVFTWTPATPGGFNFTVRASDGNLTHDQPVAVTVESPLPGPDVDTDGDGLSDLLEFAFLTNITIPNGNPFRVGSVNAGTVTLEFPWNWQATELSWQLRHGRDLSNTAAWPVIDPGTTTTTREGDIDRITVSPARVDPDRGFYMLEVIGN